MAKASLSAETRSDRGKGNARKLRAEGRVPGVIYGHAREAQSLSVVARELDRLLGTIAAGSTVVELSIGGAGSNTTILEIPPHPFRKPGLPNDFHELPAGEIVSVKVPPDYVGIP